MAIKASVQASLVGSSVPAGTIISFGGATAPSGWLLCDGAPISRTTYAPLYNAVLLAWGDGSKNADGSSSGYSGTHFNLPDLRGVFLRGVDGTKGRDPDKTLRATSNIGGNAGNNVGSMQANATKKNGLGLSVGTHEHNVIAEKTGRGWKVVGTEINAYDGANWIAGVDASIDTYRSNGSWKAYAATANVSLPGGVGYEDNETRPLNANVNYIIKY